MQEKIRKLLRNRKKGFTLVELIVVIAILAILMMLLIPTMTGIIGDAKQQVYEGNARTAYSALKAAAIKLDSTGVTPTNDNVWATAQDYLGADFMSGTSKVDFTITGDATNGYDVNGVTWHGNNGESGTYTPAQPANPPVSN